MHPAVSIIIPCHQAHATLSETVRSVLQQTMQNWELILVSDDGECYLPILHEQGINDKRIREHPLRTKRAGHTLARDRGLQLARGKLIADLDADDLWYPERLTHLIPLAQRYGAAQDVLECFDHQATLGFSGPLDNSVELLLPTAIIGFDMPFHLVVRRDVIPAPWATFPVYAPDAIRTAIIASRQAVAWLHKPLLRYRISANSMTQSITGGQHMDKAYSQILNTLQYRDGYGLSKRLRIQLAHALREKRKRNRTHLLATKHNSDLPSFIPWALHLKQHPT